MEFDLSKENIQPLRGGRNVSQLEVALQAQDNTDLQRELLHQKEEFENAIRNYAGNDPLENWYYYISWVEQSYPKHGHEGNLVPLLEDCLAKFEHDDRYTNDYRFCKLWIKYNDMQQNPLELFHMMHARGLCRGCADLYRAWAYYHEAAGDYRSANVVFQLGIRELAQPYEELVMAHQNMVYAAGQQVISGINEERLIEQRKALTTLRSYKPGKVGSVRVIGSSEAGIVPASTSSTMQSNVVVPIYEDRGDFVRSNEAAAPDSILSVARRQVAPKENVIKPGTWTSAGSHWKGAVHHEPKFTVHEDASEIRNAGLNLPTEFFRVTHEDFSHWKSLLYIAEPDDPHRIPMYPKSKVYSGNDTEYSIEEIRALRYLVRSGNRLNVSHVETEQAIQSILGGQGIIKEELPLQDGTDLIQLDEDRDEVEFVGVTNLPPQEAQLLLQQQHRQHMSPRSVPPQVYEDFLQQSTHQPGATSTDSSKQNKLLSPLIFGQNLAQDQLVSFQKSAATPQGAALKNETTLSNFGDDLNVLWRSSNDLVSELVHVEKPNVTKFSIYEESHVDQLQPKGSAMKTLPFKILSDEELAETGSRGGHDIAAAAQPGDGAKRIVIFEDDSSSAFAEARPSPPSTQPDLELSCNTQVFNFNLNVMQVSTPQTKQNQFGSPVNQDALLEARKQLFDSSAKKRISTILEETESYGSSGSKSCTSQLKRDNMKVINEESSGYNFNLAQNLKANEALRTSLLEFMDCESGQSSPVTETPITPLDKAPSDPFKPALLSSLLQSVGFPGRHTDGYVKLLSTPRLAVRKEVSYIGDDRYYIDKILGKGTYGQVFKATDARTNRTVALKLQKPPNCWEFYICRELQGRLANHPLRECFMHVEIGYFSDQVSVFVSEFSPCGSLLDVANTYRQKMGHTLKQGICTYLCVEMLKIVSAMHRAHIIHADIKPDNFLVYIVSDGLQLKLIDFGCSIDMTFFPPGTSFIRRVTTKDFICPEMQDGRPWNYHTDLFCVAATAHVLLFDKYMQLQKNGDMWSITQRFTRYMKLDLWNTFFSTLLNQQKGPADSEHLISFLTDNLHYWGDEVGTELRKLVNMLNNR